MMTKREKFEVIGKVFAELDNEYRDEIMEFTAKEIAALDSKNIAAKKRAAEKRAAGDSLREAIHGIMTNEPKTVNDILSELGDDSLTPAKITARTKQLIDAGEVVKTTVKVDGRKLIAYTVA